MKQLKKTLVSAVLAITLMGGTIAHAAAFKDVRSDNWAYDTIEWASTNNIAAGYGDGTFKPSKSVTEEEFLALLIRSFKGKDFDATPDKGGKWSDTYYTIAKENNYPVSAKRDAVINRQSVAEIIVGTQGKNYSGNDAIQFMLGKGLASGKSSATFKGYVGSDTLTRAEAVQFIRNVLDNASSKDLLPRPTTPSPKSELPDLPVQKDFVVGKTDPKLATQTAQVQTAISDTAYIAGYNGDRGSVFLSDANKVIFMSYNAPQEADQTTVINTTALVKSGGKVDQEKVDAIVTALKVLGMPVDSKLGTAIAECLGKDGVEKTMKFGNINMQLVPTGYGRVLMYVD